MKNIFKNNFLAFGLVGLILFSPVIVSAQIFDTGSLLESLFGNLFDFGGFGGGIFGRGANQNIVSVNLTGSGEVPAVSTNASGRLILSFNPAHTAADFSLAVFNGMNVTEAHLHCAQPGQNGPAIATLFGKIPGGFDNNGNLASFTLTDDNILPEGATCSTPVNSITTLFNAIRNGIIYVNVHTVAHPSGEIRGQFASSGDTTTLQIRDLQHGVNAGDIQRGVAVIRNQAEFDQLRNALSTATTSIPSVNFNNETVLAVFEGRQNTGGFNIEVTNVKDFPSFVRVTIQETIPGSGCVVSQAVTSPFDIVGIPKTEKRVIIDHRIRETQCSEVGHL